MVKNVLNYFETNTGLLKHISNTFIGILNQYPNFGTKSLKLTLTINFVIFTAIFNMNFNIWLFLDIACLSYQGVLLVCLGFLLVLECTGNSLRNQNPVQKLAAFMLINYSILILPLLILTSFKSYIPESQDYRTIFAIIVINNCLGIFFIFLKLLFMHNFIPYMDILSSPIDVITIYTLLEGVFDTFFLFLHSRNFDQTLLISYITIEKIILVFWLFTSFKIYNLRVEPIAKGFYVMRNVVSLMRFIQIIFDLPTNVFVHLIVAVSVLLPMDTIIRKYNLQDIFSDSNKVPLIDLARIVFICMDIAKMDELTICERYFTTCFLNHKKDCRKADCLCKRSICRYDNSSFNDFLVELVEENIKTAQFNFKDTAIYISILIKRDKSITTVNEILFKCVSAVDSSYFNLFYKSYFENYIQKILEKKSSNLINIKKSLKYDYNKTELANNMYKENLPIHRLIFYKKCYDSAHKDIACAIAESKNFIMVALYGQINPLQFFKCLENLFKINNRLELNLKDISLISSDLHIRHLLLFHTYFAYINYNQKQTLDIKSELLMLSKQKYFERKFFIEITGEYIFEKSVAIVAHINASEIGNIDMVYGDTQEIFDMGEHQLIGENVMNIMPQIIAENHSAIMNGYPFEIEKYIMHRYIYSYLCNSSKLILPLTGVFKYLPIYSVKNGILLCTYWKDVKNDEQNYIFLDDDYTVKHYSKGLLNFMKSSCIDYDIPIQSLTDDMTSYLSIIETEKQKYIDTVISNVSFTIKKMLIPDLKFSAAFTFKDNKGLSKSEIKFNVQVQLMFAVKAKGDYCINKILILTEPIRVNIQSKLLEMKNGPSSLYMKSTSQNLETFGTFYSNTYNSNVMGGSSKVIYEREERRLNKMYDNPFSKECKLSALKRTLFDKQNQNNAKNFYMEDGLNRFTEHLRKQQSTSPSNKSSSQVFKKFYEKTEINYSKIRMDRPIYSILCLFVICIIFTGFKHRALFTSKFIDIKSNVVNNMQIICTLSEVMQLKFYQYYTSKNSNEQQKEEASSPTLDYYINMTLYSLNIHFESIKQRGASENYNLNVGDINYTKMIELMSFTLQQNFKDNDTIYYFSNFIKTDYVLQTNDLGLFDTLNKKITGLYNVAQDLTSYANDCIKNDISHIYLVFNLEFALLISLACLNVILIFIKLYKIGYNLTTINNLNTNQLKNRYKELCEIQKFIQICCGFDEDYDEKLNRLYRGSLAIYEKENTSQKIKNERIRLNLLSLKFLCNSLILYVFVLLGALFSLSHVSSLNIKDELSSQLKYSETIDRIYEYHFNNNYFVNSFLINQLLLTETGNLLTEKYYTPYDIVSKETLWKDNISEFPRVCDEESLTFEFLYSPDRKINFCTDDLANYMKNMSVFRFYVYALDTKSSFMKSSIEFGDFGELWAKTILNLIYTHADLYSRYAKFKDYLRVTNVVDIPLFVQVLTILLYILLTLITFINYVLYLDKEKISLYAYRLYGKYYIENDAFLLLSYMISFGLGKKMRIPNL